MLRFSDEGPAFPPELVEALFAGEVVFLCGAGVSAPQLPGFQGLVERCFADLGLEKEAPERASFADRRFEETLGTLSRRLADPEELIDIVCAAVQAPAAVDLSNHRIILRLSRDLENRPLVVTTNFDTLIERALPLVGMSGSVRGLSFAGQALPLPGGKRFDGIIHLHGRIDDEQLALERTQLVLTSADYGEAYMRSGWASRFLFDLARCKTIVLVGYSAGDAPVRYFLNVLEADRERFTDMRTVYALDALQEGEEEADPRWASVAVRALPYATPIRNGTAHPDHGVLWRDLGQLADLIERPRATRRNWLAHLLQKAAANLNTLERDRAIWLLGSEGSADLWDLPASTVSDVGWFEFMREYGLLTADRAWVLAAWFARDFTDPARFELAIEWGPRFGTALFKEIRRRILQVNGLPPLWTKAWRMLVAGEGRDAPDIFDGVVCVTEAVKAPSVLQDDLERAVSLLTPALKFSKRAADRASTQEHPADLAYARMQVRDRNGLWELVEALQGVPRAEPVLALATQALRSAIETSRDAGLIVGDDDFNHFSVPSIERHPQNEFRDGVVFLTTLMSAVFAILAPQDSATARRYGHLWKALPGRVGRRLWLHALRSAAFTADEAVTALIELGPNDFWSSSREMPLVIRERSRGADAALLATLEERILSTASVYFGAFARDAGDVDWRELAGDRAVWLRLSMLTEAGVLSEKGAASLARIQADREHLNRAVDDRDFFGSYMSAVQSVVGDPSPIVAARPDDRIQVAKTTLSAYPFEQQLGWGVFCRTDPDGALEALTATTLSLDNAGLWREFLSTVAFLQEGDAEKRTECAIKTFEGLATAGDAFVEAIVAPLVDVFMVHPRGEEDLRGWWHRLFACALNVPEAVGSRCEDWLLAPAARLTQAALLDIDRCKRRGDLVSRRLLARLATIAAERHTPFASLAALANDAAFLLSLDCRAAIDRLASALATDDDDGRDLRTVLVLHARNTAELGQAFRAPILRGVAEFSTPPQGANAVAAKVLVPTLNALRDQSPGIWAIDFDDARRALHEGSPIVREGAVRCLADWFAQEGDRAAFWRSLVAPLLARIWPRDRRHRDRKLTAQLVRLLMQTEEAFPDALAKLKPYLTPSTMALYLVTSSEMPERWPRDTLELLWLLREVPISAASYELARLVERLRTADPTLETDRRLQWLEYRAPRFA